MQDLPDNKFEGKPCRTCGETLRYRTKKPCGKCITCSIDQQRRARSGLPEMWPVDISVTAATTEPVKIGKPCKRCESPVRYSQTKIGTCVRCHKQWRRDYEIQYPKYLNGLYRALGIDKNKYLSMCEEQDWRCAICKEIPKKLVADHCHTAGNFRGLICTYCNSGLGFFKDDPIRMLAAIEYLRGC